VEAASSEDSSVRGGVEACWVGLAIGEGERAEESSGQASSMGTVFSTLCERKGLRRRRWDLVRWEEMEVWVSSSIGPRLGRRTEDVEGEEEALGEGEFGGKARGRWTAGME
jgi:hypothetical protein